MGFSRQEYWSALPFPPPGDLPDSGIKPRSPALQADSLSHEHPKYHILVHTLLAESQIMNGHAPSPVESREAPPTSSFPGFSEPP